MVCTSWMRWTLDEGTVNRWSSGAVGAHPAAVVAGDADGEHAQPPALADGAHQVLGVAAGRDRQQHVAGAAQGEQLADEDVVVADVVADRGDHGDVGGEAERGDRRARARTGASSSATMSAADVALPPLPQASTRPPAATALAMARAQAATSSARSSSRLAAQRVALRRLLQRRAGQLGHHRGVRPTAAR